MSLITYLKDVKGEMKHIVWPTRRQAVGFTVLVAVISIATSLYLGAFDSFFSLLLKKIAL